MTVRLKVQKTAEFFLAASFFAGLAITAIAYFDGLITDNIPAVFWYSLVPFVLFLSAASHWIYLDRRQADARVQLATRIADQEQDRSETGDENSRTRVTDRDSSFPEQVLLGFLVLIPMMLTDGNTIEGYMARCLSYAVIFSVAWYVVMRLRMQTAAREIENMSQLVGESNPVLQASERKTAGGS